jgi:hypothetical protein
MDFTYKKSSEEEIRKVIDKLSEGNWIHISCFQKLSEDLIREFQDKVN